MFSVRGDVHKIYLRLKKVAEEEHTFNQMKELKEIDEIQCLYQSIDSCILKKIHYRMIKEKTGSGTIPIFVTAIPWLCFLFAKQLQQFLFDEGSLLWVFFVVIYITLLVISVILHFHERSWAAVHIEIIQDILKKRNE